MTLTNDSQTVHTCQTRSVCKPRPPAYIQGPASISTITSDPRPVFEARLVFKTRLLFEEIRYFVLSLLTDFNSFCRYCALYALTLLVGHQEEHSACKKLVMRCWHGYLSGARVRMICIWSSWCHCHPIISCFIKIHSGLAFLLPIHPSDVGCLSLLSFQCCEAPLSIDLVNVHVWLIDCQLCTSWLVAAAAALIDTEPPLYLRGHIRVICWSGTREDYQNCSVRGVYPPSNIGAVPPTKGSSK